jgi:hypothetical protein
MPIYPLPTPIIQRLPAYPVVSPYSPDALGNSLSYEGAIVGFAAASWPASAVCIGYPFSLPNPETARQMWVYNAATSIGTVDLGIYDAAGNLLVSKGTTAQSGTNDLQLFDITDTELAPDVTYYAMMTMRGVSGIINRMALNTLGSYRAQGFIQANPTFPLPNPITFVAPSWNYVPIFGIQLKTVI